MQYQATRHVANNMAISDSIEYKVEMNSSFFSFEQLQYMDELCGAVCNCTFTLQVKNSAVCRMQCAVCIVIEQLTSASELYFPLVLPLPIPSPPLLLLRHVFLNFAMTLYIKNTYMLYTTCYMRFKSANNNAAQIVL